MGRTCFFFPPQSVPVHLSKLYKEEIDKMLDLGVITDWVNSIVLSQTANEKGEITKLRVCLDPRDLNKWIKRDQHYTKTIDEVVTQLNDAKFFTLVKAKKGYWHFPLDEVSSYLTTFSTPLIHWDSPGYPLASSFLEGLSSFTGTGQHLRLWFHGTEKRQEFSWRH